jgi:hypothetical protein
VRVFSDRFTGSGDCAECHSFLTDQAGNDVSIDTHWRSTMMANAATDPLWQAKVSSEVARNPQLEAVIEEKCANCHMPMAHTEAVANEEPVGISGSGFASPEHPLNALAIDGVSCTLCHQIQGEGLGEAATFSGAYPIDVQATSPDRPIYGPFPDPLPNPMRMHVGYTPVEGPHTLDSGLCATCHTLYTPYVDAQGNVLGTFPEQTAYLEWEHSLFGGQGISCQQCHMPAAAEAALTSNHPPGLRTLREPFAQHHFVGGNTFMLNMLRAQAEALELTAGTEHFDATLQRTAERIGTAAKVSIVDIGLDGDVLTLDVELENVAGHKFPTGFPSRRAWIHLSLYDAADKLVFESGQPQADGSIAGSDADQDPARYEPHCDLISDPDQVQIYEPIMLDSDGEVTYTLLRAAAYAKDNRLLPGGFDKATAGEDIAVRGAAAKDETFGGGSDRVGYQIDVKGHEGPYTVRAELLYQALSYRFAQDLCQEETAQAEIVCSYYDGADHTADVIASAERKVR